MTFSKVSRIVDAGLSFLAGVTMLLGVTAARADITIGVVQPLTGPVAGLGIPAKNAVALWPKTIGGEPVKVIILDDASDPTTGIKATQRLITDYKVDVLIGSTATAVAMAMSDIAADSGTPQLAISPASVPPNREKWIFRLPQSNLIMARSLVAHMKRSGVKTVGFLGYNDGMGEEWLKEFTTDATKNDIKLIGTERFTRVDTSVTAQALKLVAANPDAILIVASGSGAGMPQKAIMDRGYKGAVYQTHAAAMPELMRTAGKDANGAFVVSGPAAMAEQLPDSNPSKQLALAFVREYETAYGPGSRNQVAGHVFGALAVLEKAVPVAMTKAKPGTPEFRAALRDAFETMGPTLLPQGVLNWTAEDHWGYRDNAGVMLKVVNGEFKVDQ